MLLFSNRRYHNHQHCEYILKLKAKQQSEQQKRLLLASNLLYGEPPLSHYYCHRNSRPPLFNSSTGKLAHFLAVNDRGKLNWWSWGWWWSSTSTIIIHLHSIQFYYLKQRYKLSDRTLQYNLPLLSIPLLMSFIVISNGFHVFSVQNCSFLCDYCYSCYKQACGCLLQFEKKAELLTKRNHDLQCEEDDDDDDHMLIIDRPYFTPL